MVNEPLDGDSEATDVDGDEFVTAARLAEATATGDRIHAELQQSIDALQQATKHPRLNDRVLFGLTRWHALIVGYCLLWGALIVGLWQLENLSRDFEENSKDRAIEQCEQTNEGRQRIRDFVDDLTDNADVLGLAALRLPLLDCSKAGNAESPIPTIPEPPLSTGEGSESRAGG